MSHLSRALSTVAMALACAASQTNAQPAPPPSSVPATAHVAIRSLNDLLDPIRRKHDLPALAGAIVQGDALIAVGAVGHRKSGESAAVTPTDRFHIGSCTKAMTATMIGLLVERGKLNWGTTIPEVFPDFIDTMNPEYRNVTLQQLLTHRSGIPADLSPSGLWGKLWSHTGTPVEQRQALLEGALRLKPDASPGARFIYSNTGYAIAGAMAERVMGEPWEKLMQRMLFEPLGMRSAGFGAPGTPDRIDEPCGHVRRDSRLQPIAPGKGADNPAAIGPAGTVHCSIGDWAKFIALHLRGARGEGRLLEHATFKTLHTPARDQEYAMGWVVTRRDWADGDVLTHAGSNTMWYCVVWLAPTKDFAILICCNDGSEVAPKACDEAAWALIQDHLSHHKDVKPAK